MGSNPSLIRVRRQVGRGCFARSAAGAAPPRCTIARPALAVHPALRDRAGSSRAACPPHATTSSFTGCPGTCLASSHRLAHVILLPAPPEAAAQQVFVHAHLVEPDARRPPPPRPTWRHRSACRPTPRRTPSLIMRRAVHRLQRRMVQERRAIRRRRSPCLPSQARRFRVARPVSPTAASVCRAAPRPAALAMAACLSTARVLALAPNVIGIASPAPTSPATTCLPPRPRHRRPRPARGFTPGLLQWPKPSRRSETSLAPNTGALRDGGRVQHVQAASRRLRTARVPFVFSTVSSRGSGLPMMVHSPKAASAPRSEGTGILRRSRRRARHSATTAPARGIGDRTTGASRRFARAGIHVPALRRRLHQHGPRRRTALAHVVHARPDPPAAARAACRPRRACWPGSPRAAHTRSSPWTSRPRAPRPPAAPARSVSPAPSRSVRSAPPPCRPA